jgi:hypothetical protein
MALPAPPPPGRHDMAYEGTNVDSSTITDKDREMAKRCASCPVCNLARQKQRGLAFWFVKRVEEGVCPYCKAYEKVYGRKAHEPAAR